MKKILVVGGTGFIGFHVIKEAKRRNWKITSISLNKPKKKRFHKNVKYIFVNIEKFNLLKKNLKGNFDFIINAGGYGQHPNFGKSGEKLFKSHFLGLVNLVKIFSKKKVKKLIQIGSSAEYGNAKSPQIETFPCKPNSPYALTKLSCTNFLKNFNKIYNFPAVILRFYQVYGPYQDTNRLLPQVIENCLKNKKFPVTKGQQHCDFCFVDDVVKAIFKALQSKKAEGEIINIGSGKPIRIKKIINLTQKLIKKGTPEFGKIKYKKNINMRSFPNIKKAKKIINWSPKINIYKGLNLTINTYK